MEVIYNNGSNMRLQLQGGLNSNAFARIRDKEVLSGCREVHTYSYRIAETCEKNQWQKPMGSNSNEI